MNTYLYHVSMDLDLTEKLFIPRVPQFRLFNEDAKIKRICACPSLEEAVGAFPYKHVFVNRKMRYREENYLVYYTVPKEGVVHRMYEEIKDLVPDAHKTKEYWIMEPFTATPILIKVNKLTLKGFCKYTCQCKGAVKEFEFENTIENYDRQCSYTFISRRAVKRAIAFAEANHLHYEIVEDYYCKLTPSYYVENPKTFKGNTKKYRWVTINFEIPAGVDLTTLWMLNFEQLNRLERKGVYLKPFTGFDWEE